ncbi:MAG: N-6 DNA methylase [Candidatus Micrarchaeia archaeon]|jgi:type I restriction-modification system DNA methylase subunit
MDKEQTKEKMQELINLFASNQDEYESKEYQESQLRTDFIDSLFKRLGWDVSNKAGLGLREREVLVEKGDTKGRPDYSFRVNGEERFFVEAKAVSKGTDNEESVFQAKRYGWNTRKVNIVVLTDFKSFKVFDSSLKPNVKQPRVGLLFELDFSKYSSSDFEKLWLFSHDSVVAGSLDKLGLKDASAKRLRVPVDEAFLEQMTTWRETLAKDFFKNNAEMSVRSLNDVVQRLLDRLVFIRILEDRKIIESKTLREIADNWKESQHRDIQTQLNALFRQLNDDFNGEIFKPHPCETIAYDSKTIAEIIDELYYPKSPYDFAVIGVELLGIIYEKYLGKTIHMTEKRIKVEEKPEVRKAGGVFYTPKWVVEYIVENTVGKLFEGKTPEEVAKIRVLDPACGSGSFLIGALEKMLDYHLDYYSKNPKEAKRGTLFPNLIVERDFEGNEIHRLSIQTKGEILKNNIYGVDIDPQAVEITMMSLYIKVLEGERTLPHNKELLPSLSNNIRCGNSLIGFDFLEQKTLLDDSEKEKANPFEWRSKTTGFGNVIGEEGGFDAIIGNPPYIRIQTMKEWAPKQVEYFSKKYKTAESGNYDIYVVFVEKATELLAKNGLFGFILPHKFFQADYGKNLRKLISENKLLQEIVNFKDQQVFDEATTYTCLLFLSKKEKNAFKYAETIKLENPASQLQTIQTNKEYENDTLRVGRLPITNISEQSWQFGLGKETQLLENLRNVKTKLSAIASTIFVGLQTSADPIYIVERKNPPNEGNLVEVYSKALDKNFKIEAEILKPLLKGQEIKRYSTPFWKYWLIFPYAIVNGKAEVISKEELEKKYPKAWQYLSENRKRLQERDKGSKMGDSWFAYVYPKNLVEFAQPKIMTQVLANRASFTLDKIGLYYFVGGGNAGGYGVKLKPDSGLDLRYVTALLNSKLLDFYLKKVSTPFRGGYFSYAKRFIELLPIHVPDKAEQAKSDEMITLTDKVLELNKKKLETADATKKELLDREAKVYEEKIDTLVFDLYSLTAEERRIVEESIK